MQPQSTESVAEPEQTPARSLALGDTKPGEPGASVTNPLGLIVLIGLLVLLWVKAGKSSVFFVFGLVFMIFLHELGHFVTARMTGMKATRFFVGMGPTIISRTRGETEYGLKAIPAGAFVAISGMNNLDPVPPEDEARAYKNASYPRRMLVITAGSMMHFLQAIVIFVFMFSIVGLPDENGAWEIEVLSKLNDGSAAPADAAGLEVGDRIVSVNGSSTVRFEDLREYVSARPGEEIAIGIERDGQLIERTTTLATIPHEGDVDTGFLGVGPHFVDKERFGPLTGLEAFKDVFTSTFSSMANIFSPSGLQNLGSLLFEGSEDVSMDSEEAGGRPVSVVGVVRIAGSPEFGWFGRLLFLGSINVFVGVFNLVPLLPLDGGHAAVGTYERLRSRKGKRYQVDFAKLMPLTYGVVTLLGFLFISTLWLDILRPIG